MNRLQEHRGPDGEGIWQHTSRTLGFGHRRLSVIDLTTGQQPMRDARGNWITYNGEIYNYLELRRELGEHRFVTTSDTEVILAAYEQWGPDCVRRLRGMFAFAIWDQANQTLFCARDRFGIKPFYYTVIGDELYFASEVKALLPFVPAIDTDTDAFAEYLTFQLCLSGKTLFRGIAELPPAHVLEVAHGAIHTRRYWEIYYDLDFDHTENYFEDRIRQLLSESIDLHLRSDVPLGAYVSGGLDSGIVATLASRSNSDLIGFHGTFAHGPEFDESRYARTVAEAATFPLHETVISAADFIDNIRRVIYHLDFPIAGPGSFPQYMVSALASRHRKVVLGGQGGDEIFGGYARYLIAYFEQCIKAAIEGTMTSGNFVVTYESIIPNLSVLRAYKPLLQEFWQQGLFEDMDRRYYRLINRAVHLKDEVRWDRLSGQTAFETFRAIFHGKNVRKESYFDLMTHFDFKTLLPALLQVEDRVSMAHGLESRVPLLDHPLVELAATIPSSIKFKGGELKRALIKAFGPILPRDVVHRQEKMGFPVPLAAWARGDARDFIRDTFATQSAREREFIDNEQVLRGLGEESKFGRKLWGLLSLELWQQEFHDRQAAYGSMLAAEIAAGDVVPSAETGVLEQVEARSRYPSAASLQARDGRSDRGTFSVSEDACES
jgi:asparagine synthase (glutamine-hydrolysing)